MAMVKKRLYDAWSYFSSKDELTLKQLTLPEQPLPATCKSIPLLIPNNTYYSPEESTLQLRKGQLHIHQFIFFF